MFFPSLFMIRLYHPKEPLNQNARNPLAYKKFIRAILFQSQVITILNVTAALTKGLLTGNKLFSDPACFGSQGTSQKPLPLSVDREPQACGKASIGAGLQGERDSVLALEAITFTGLLFSSVDEVRPNRKGV